MKLAFVGFGEAAFHLAGGLRGAGVAEIFAFDIHTHTAGRGELIQARAGEAQVKLVESSGELAASAEIILSTVTSDQAAVAAQQCAPFLNSRHLYADHNSVSPALKQAIERTIETTGARFVEIAMMAPVPPYGHRVPMLAGGKSAPELIEAFAGLGMNIEFTGPEVGVASATKMFRSVVIKGLEALLTECVLGASKYNAVEGVFASLRETLPGVDWEKLTDYLVGRVVVHGERRAREMEEVAETLRAIGVEPLMAEATAKRMDWSVALGLKAKFKGEMPKSYRDVVAVVSGDVRPVR